MQRLRHTLLVGDAATIRAMVVRKMKTDRRDALHMLDLLSHDRFPTIWVPDPATRDLRALLTHRMRLVRIRTMVKNGLHAIELLVHVYNGGPSILSRDRGPKDIGPTRKFRIKSSSSRATAAGRRPERHEARAEYIGLKTRHVRAWTAWASEG